MVGQGWVSARWGAQVRSRAAAEGLIAKQLYYAPAGQAGQAGGSCSLQAEAGAQLDSHLPSNLHSLSLLLALTCAPYTHRSSS